MAFDPTSGLLYGTNWNNLTNINELYTIDPVTGATSLIGSLGVGAGIGGIVFDGSGNLFGTYGGGQSANNFVSIDKNTGVATLIGPTGYPAVTGLTALGGPAIDVTPASLATSLPLGGTDVLQMKVHNIAPAGSGALTWSIVEDAVPGGGDAGWLSVNPNAGSTASQDSTTVNVNIDAYGLAAGVYDCNLLVNSDDAANPQVVVPVQLTVTGTPATAVKGDVYATMGYAGTGELLRIDPVTGNATVIGDTRTAGMPGLAINAFGEIFGVGGTNANDQNLYRIDAATGAVVFIGSTGVGCFQAMAFDDAGVLWGIGPCGPDMLWMVDTATGGLTNGPAVNPNMVGLAFDPTSGVLYGVEWNNTSNIDNLYTIDTATGATTLVGTLGVGTGVGDIYFDATGNLFGVVGGGQVPNDFVSIDKITGAASYVGATGFTGITAITYAANYAVAVDDDTPAATPVSYTLHNAAPNPFNPMTTIKFELPKEAAVTINVYDTAGRRVKTLLEGVHSAGTHEVTFKADRLGSGVYFYEMRAGNFREIKKMMLVK
jgi:hypothetical protein